MMILLLLLLLLQLLLVAVILCGSRGSNRNRCRAIAKKSWADVYAKDDGGDASEDVSAPFVADS